MTQRGIWFAGEMPTQRMVELARRAEDAGLESVWMAEGYYARDGLVPLAAIAAATSRVAVGTSVINPYTRHPAVLAMSFATLDELSGGRAILGIGAGARHQVEGQMGYDASRPYTAVREAVEVMDRMAAGEHLDYEGTVVTARDVRLIVQGARRLPMYIAAVGPKMCRLAGERGSGVFLPQVTAPFVRRAVELVAEGARSAGRDPADIDIAAMIVMAVADDHRSAARMLAPLVGILLLPPEGERVLEQNDLDPAIAQRLRDGWATSGFRGLVEHVSLEMVEKLSIAGPADFCRAKLQELVDAGVTHPVVSMVGTAPEATIDVVSTIR